MNTDEQRNETVGVEFVGPALGLFGRALLMGIVSALVLPAPWMAVWFYRWCVGNIRLSDKTPMSFSGEGGQIWFPMMAMMALSLVGQLKPFLPLLLIPVNCYFSLIIARWFWRNIVPGGGGTKISFVGTYLPFLGWNVLFMLSIFTIVGWAWVEVGMIRWFCRNLKSGNHVVEFEGDGWNILWRTVAFAFSCVLIIPIPWTLRWLVQWYLGNFSIRKVTA